MVTVARSFWRAKGRGPVVSSTVLPEACSPDFTASADTPGYRSLEGLSAAQAISVVFKALVIMTAANWRKLLKRREMEGEKGRERARGPLLLSGEGRGHRQHSAPTLVFSLTFHCGLLAPAGSALSRCPQPGRCRGLSTSKQTPGSASEVYSVTVHLQSCLEVTLGFCLQSQGAA